MGTARMPTTCLPKLLPSLRKATSHGYSPSGVLSKGRTLQHPDSATVCHSNGTGSLLCPLRYSSDQLSGPASSCPAPGLETCHACQCLLLMVSVPAQEENLAGLARPKAGADWCTQRVGWDGSKRGGFPGCSTPALASSHLAAVRW